MNFPFLDNFRLHLTVQDISIRDSGFMENSLQVTSCVTPIEDSMDTRISPDSGFF